MQSYAGVRISGSILAEVAMIIGSYSGCRVSISNKDTGETLDLWCNMYGYGKISWYAELRIVTLAIIHGICMLKLQFQ
jgi:hypothetical protein